MPCTKSEALGDDQNRIGALLAAAINGPVDAQLRGRATGQ